MRGERPRRFGIEEEYLLLDVKSGRPIDRAAEVIASMPSTVREAEHEFFASQLETSTHVCTEAADASAALHAFREAASHAASEHDALLASTGLPPIGGDAAGNVTADGRYRRIEAEMRTAGAHQYVTGTHVHVEMPSRAVGVEVLARLGRWAPILMAMTANSPVWCDALTGFASWRHIIATSWPVVGYPPEFQTAHAYAESVEQLTKSGVLLDSGVVTWLARLSENFPTLELRIADAQLDADDAVAFAMIVRALVSRTIAEMEDGVARPKMAPGLVDGAIWLAARNGLESDLVDPLTAEAVPALEMLGRCIDPLERELDTAGDTDRVSAFVERLRTVGGPASRQRAAFSEAGISGLLSLYRGGMKRHGASE